MKTKLRKTTAKVLLFMLAFIVTSTFSFAEPQVVSAASGKC